MPAHDPNGGPARQRQGGPRGASAVGVSMLRVRNEIIRSLICPCTPVIARTSWPAASEI
jgi:hypothetical protein